MLYLVATPIGNLKDITLRALEILKSVDFILCEDTRVTRKLLDHYEIKNKKLIAYHHHTDAKKTAEIIELIKNNNVALVTDAGTPGISDPGNILIAALAGTGFDLSAVSVIPIPGPSALITALSISGLPTDKFIFKGFVPHKKGRETFLRQVLEAKETVVFYESCHRIIKCLEQLNLFCRDRSRPVQMVVCRELTKKFETIYRGTAEEILAQIKKEFPNGTPKGEFVIISQ
ncbi:MAG TPA: 16S rRNA (cytidine(1402)-2'-O)-methyltransferase [bacterium]|nr:16S rRNA (cytidine(1402)-2'-O)-methyltransferase [bacterium]HPL95188.1 16S rRNA (cytidine(1402)-2'-O)-methyltransferase [bacterium]